MLYARRTYFTLTALLAAAALGGCAGSVPSTTTGTASVDASTLGGPAGLRVPARSIEQFRPGWLSPAAKSKPLIYVSDFSASAVDIYQQGGSNPSPIGQITNGIDGPLGTFVDDHGTLYVANALANTVTEYPAGSTTPSVTLSTDINYPISVAVDRKGNVAVGEFAQGTILEFPPGNSTPTVTITLLTKPEGLAFNATNHLYAAWNVTGSNLFGHVSKCVPMQATCVDLGITEGESGGLAIDKTGNVVLGDQTNSVINIYAPHATSPSRTISATGHPPYKFEFGRREQTLYVADNVHGVVVSYDYATGAQKGTISTGLQSAWGVSLSPAARYGR